MHGGEDTPGAGLDVAENDVTDFDPIPEVFLQGFGTLDYKVRPEVLRYDRLLETSIQLDDRCLVLESVAGCVR